MKKLLENLWDEFLSSECAVLNTEKERILIKKAAQIRKNTLAMFTKEQNESIENYVEILYEMNSVYAKKAFMIGCEFSMSFLLETNALKKEDLQ